MVLEMYWWPERIVEKVTKRIDVVQCMYQEKYHRMNLDCYADKKVLGRLDWCHSILHH